MPGMTCIGTATKLGYHRLRMISISGCHCICRLQPVFVVWQSGLRGRRRLTTNKDHRQWSPDVTFHEPLEQKIVVINITDPKTHKQESRCFEPFSPVPWSAILEYNQKLSRENLLESSHVPWIHTHKIRCLGRLFQFASPSFLPWLVRLWLKPTTHNMW